MRFLLLDANSILNRAFYGIRLLTAKDGTPTNGIYGFLNILFKYIKELEPTHIAAAFDLKAPTFRHKMYDGYKATRKPMPDDLVPQFPVLKEILSAMNIPVIEKEGFEADDIIGTISSVCDKENIECCILSGDKDDLQLATKNTKIYLVTTKMGATDTKIYDEDEVFVAYGVKPREFIDCKAIMGDKSDNIPGIAGIGEKGALALISEFKSLDGVYENLDSTSISKSTRAKLENDRDAAYLSLKLATIDKSVPLDFKTDDALVCDWNLDLLIPLLKRLELKSMLKRIEEMTPDASLAQDASEITYDKVVYLENSDDFSSFYSSKNKTIFYMLDEKTPAIVFTQDASLVYYAKIDNNTIASVKDLLESEEYEKITHGLKKDILFLRKHKIQPKNVVFDSEIASYLLYPSRKSYDFDELVLDFCNMKIKKEQADDIRISLTDIMSGEEKEYLISKVCALFHLHKLLKNELEEKNLTGLFTDIEMPLVFVLADMEICGFKIDKERLLEFGADLSGKIKALTDEIYSLAGHEFNINSPKQLGVILFEELMLTPAKKTKTGYQTSADVLEKLSGKHEIIDKILEYRQLTKLNSTYVTGLLAVIDPKTKRVHSSLKQTVTQTGRISSSEPNLQNIPVRTPLGKNLRKMFVAENDDYILVDADYSQIELRVLAHIADDKNMIEAFKSGFDIHKSTAAKIFNISPDEVTDAMRSAAKAINFGLVYGMGEFTLSKDLGISIKEAKAYIEEYLGSYPGVRKFMQEIVEFAKENGYVTTIYNRRRDIPEIKSQNHQQKSFGARVAMNTPIQGTAADIIKLAMINVFSRLKRECPKSRLILQVHDELIIEAHLSELDVVKQLLKEEMENAASLSVPLVVDMNCGKSWFDTK